MLISRFFFVLSVLVKVLSLHMIPGVLWSSFYVCFCSYGFFFPNRRRASRVVVHIFFFSIILTFVFFFLYVQSHHLHEIRSNVEIVFLFLRDVFFSYPLNFVFFFFEFLDFGWVASNGLHVQSSSLSHYRSLSSLSLSLSLVRLAV